MRSVNSEQPFETIVAGRFHRHEVIQSFADVGRDGATADIEAAAAWENALSRARASGRDLFDGQIFRLNQVSVREGVLFVEYGRTSYRDYVVGRGGALNMPFSGNADPVGTAIIVKTADGYIPFGRRSQRAEVNPGRIFTFGGFFDLSDRSPDGAPDVFRCIEREWREETGLDLSMEGLQLISIVYDRVNPHPEIAFALDVDLDSHALRACNWASELGEMELVEQGNLQQFISAHRDQFTESLLGALESYCC